MKPTTSLLLSPFVTATVSEVHGLWSDEDATRFTNFPHLPAPGDAEVRLHAMLTHYQTNAAHLGPFCIRSVDGEFLGLAGADATSDHEGPYEIWYFIVRGKWRQGIATEATRQLLGALSKERQASSVEAEAAVANEPSWRLLEKLGFVRQQMLPAARSTHEKKFDRYHYVLTKPQLPLPKEHVS